MISLTSRKPPISLFTLLGLRFTNSCALSVFPFNLPGLKGSFCSTLVGESSRGGLLLFVAGAGISSHSSPEKFSCFKKNGHSLMSIARDSFASAAEIGTGEDLIMAAMTSEVGSARRFRVGVDEPQVGGFEKSL